MKKSRIFTGIAALTLVVAGVFANKTAKKFAITTLYYGTSTATATFLTNTGCLPQLFTTNGTLNGNQLVTAQIKDGSTSYYLFYRSITPAAYHPVYNFVF